MKSKRNETYKILSDYADGLMSVGDAYKEICSIEQKYHPISIGALDSDVVEICVEAYRNGEKIEAIKTLIEEYKTNYVKFGIKEAKEYLELII